MWLRVKDTNFKNAIYIVVILLVLVITFGYVAFFTPINNTPIYTDWKKAGYRGR